MGAGMLIGGNNANYQNNVTIPAKIETKKAMKAEEALTHAERREDTAIQRQVADMKAAGINPMAYAMQNSFNGSSSNASAKQISSEAENEKNKIDSTKLLISTALTLMMMML